MVGKMLRKNDYSRKVIKSIFTQGQELVSTSQGFIPIYKRGWIMRKFDCETVRSIRQKHAQGSTYVDLAKEYDVSRTMIRRVVRGITYGEC